MKSLIGITVHRRETDDGQKDVFGLMRYYVESVRRGGGLPVMIPLGLDDSELRELYERLDGIILSGGGDMSPELCGAEPHDSIYGIDEDRDRIELNLIRWAAKEEKPFLGICRGVQVMNVALGGTLYGDIAAHAPGQPLKHNWFPGFPRDLIAHPVSVSEETRLAKILGAPIVEVNSLHHQAIGHPAPDLEVAARAPDGVIEAVELPGHRFALGVQWHPECLPDRPEMRALFAELVKAAS
ncbi:MAG TPA: gamma-glutamyl-gamma-aminobutyrate hydrolase family protein [Anaerolineales bacterium]|nr:gamma-glutamyl-gamma-aminobutyrate hydrolase family protein [Anaerolineales bacterium]